MAVRLKMRTAEKMDIVEDDGKINDEVFDATKRVWIS
nr:hypothetical protein C12D5.6 - Caenorhabditis elegans [Caenorhabditis elegans]